MNKDFGLIENIEPSKFLCGGSIYVNSNYTEESNETVNVSNMIYKIGFDSKINDIINTALDSEVDKSLELRNQEVEEFIKSKEGEIIDLIFFADNGIRGVDKVNFNECSIVYIILSNNLKMGFFVNKIIAKYIFGGNNGS